MSANLWLFAFLNAQCNICIYPLYPVQQLVKPITVEFMAFELNDKMHFAARDQNDTLFLFDFMWEIKETVYVARVATVVQ